MLRLNLKHRFVQLLMAGLSMAATTACPSTPSMDEGDPGGSGGRPGSIDAAAGGSASSDGGVDRGSDGSADPGPVADASIGRASDDGGASKLALAITPAVQDFVAPVGTTSEAVELSVTNSGDQPLGPLSFSIKGPAQADFALVQACPSLLGGGSCDVVTSLQ